VQEKTMKLKYKFIMLSFQARCKLSHQSISLVCCCESVYDNLFVSQEFIFHWSPKTFHFQVHALDIPSELFADSSDDQINFYNVNATRRTKKKLSTTTTTEQQQTSSGILFMPCDWRANI